MNAILLIDFGSTYTKVTAVDAQGRRILGHAQSYTTVEEDVSLGLDQALEILARTAGPLDFVQRYACSSAAGGLRMIASGLVPSLTAEAAKRAALGAGAKVIRTYAYDLTPADIREILSLRPDIFLLCGGTDGGNREYALNNARALAPCAPSFPIVLACNRSVSDECAGILKGAGHEVLSCENVMPTFNRLNVEPCQKVIREVFLRRIIFAKGLSKASQLVSGILMPTPAAVMTALELLSTELGELMAVDLGGATTDIYSISKGLPTNQGTLMRGLPEPFAKRTVEGDIGMRYSVRGILEAASTQEAAIVSGQSEEAVLQWVDRIQDQPGILAQSPEEQQIDCALAALAIETGLIRHAGTLEQIYTPMGLVYQQTGKDLTAITRLILTGGALVHMGKAEEIAHRAMSSTRRPDSLMPRDAQVLVDRRYILSAMGLLSQSDPDLAKELMIKEFLI